MGAVHQWWPGALLVGSPVTTKAPASATTATAATDPVATLVEPVAPGVVVPAATATVRLVEHPKRVGRVVVRPTGGRTTTSASATSPMTIGTGPGTAVVVVMAIAIAVRTFPMFWLVLFHLRHSGPIAERSPGEAGFHVDPAVVRLGRQAGVVVVVVLGAGTGRVQPAGRRRLALVHKAVQGGLVLRRGGLHRVRRGVLRRGWREREQMLTGGRLAALQLALLGFVRVLRAAEGTAPAAAGRERFGGLVEPGQRAGKVRPTHLGGHVRRHPGGCWEERDIIGISQS